MHRLGQQVQGLFQAFASGVIGIAQFSNHRLHFLVDGAFVAQPIQHFFSGGQQGRQQNRVALAVFKGVVPQDHQSIDLGHVGRLQNANEPIDGVQHSSEADFEVKFPRSIVGGDVSQALFKAIEQLGQSRIAQLRLQQLAGLSPQILGKLLKPPQADSTNQLGNFGRRQ